MKPQLMAAFEESLRDAPGQEAVLIGLRAGLERHRQRRRRQRVVLATTAAVVLAVISVVAVNSIREQALPPAQPLPVPIQEWPSTVQLNWVPDGMSLVRKSAGETSETLFYAVGRTYLLVAVDNVDLNRNLTLPGWQQKVVNGRPARLITTDSRATLSFQLPSGRWAKVDLGLSDRGDSGNLAPDLLHVAAEAREIDGPPVRTSFEPTYLPPGHRVIGRQNGPGDPNIFGSIVTSAGILQAGKVGRHPVVNDIYDEYREPDLGVGLTISLDSGAVSSMIGWEKIADIQGQPAYRNADRQAVIVPNFRGGTLIVTTTFNGAPAGHPNAPELVPLAELVKVAQGVR